MNMILITLLIIAGPVDFWSFDRILQQALCDVAFEGKEETIKEIKAAVQDRKDSKAKSYAEAQEKQKVGEKRKAEEAVTLYSQPQYKSQSELDRAMNGMGVADQLHFLKRQKRARLIGWGFSYSAEHDPDGKLRDVVYSSSADREAIRLLKTDVLKMMDLEQGRGTRAFFQKPAQPHIKVTTVGLAELGGREGQVKRRRDHLQQEVIAQAELAEAVNQDDPELVEYLRRLVDLKIWDYDYHHNRYMVKDVTYDAKDEFFQAECVFLNNDESIDSRHIHRGDGTYSNMISYRFTGPGAFTIHSLEKMGRDYELEHAKPARGPRKRPRLPVRRDEIDESSCRRSKRQRPGANSNQGSHQ